MEFDETSKACAKVFHTLATVSQQLNEFAIELRNTHGFHKVSTDADMIVYETGWRFHKYVEASFDDSTGQAAAWFFVLSQNKDRWMIDTDVSITHGDYSTELPPVLADTVDDLCKGLGVAIQQLMGTFEKGQEFRKEIDRIRASSK